MERQFLVNALVFNRNNQPPVQEGEFAQAVGERAEIVLVGLENGEIRQKTDFRSRAFGDADFAERLKRRAAFVGLRIDFAAALDFHIKALREGIYDRHADTVQAAGHFVAVVIEFAARMQHGQGDFRRRSLFCRVHVHRNAAPIINHGNTIVHMNRDRNFGAKSRHRLIYRVIHDFIH